MFFNSIDRKFALHFFSYKVLKTRILALFFDDISENFKDISCEIYQNHV